MVSSAVVANATKLLPFVTRLWLPLLNILGEKSEFRITITSPDYMEVRLFWGMISFERGEKREFVIRGTEAYVSSVANALLSRGFDVDASASYLGPERY
jgi:hypothetical protein